jgi:hypothetical protein
MVILRVSLPLLLALLTKARGVAAEVKPPREFQRNVEAVAEGHRGLEAFKRGDFSGCRRSFTRAEALAHSPTFLLFMARCLERQGALVEARSMYQRVLNEELAPNDPIPWVSAVREATLEHAALSPRIPSIVVSVLNAPIAELVVVLDGTLATQAMLDRAWELNPGKHHLSVRRSDGERAEAWFVLEEGRKALAVELSFPVKRFASEAFREPGVRAARTTPRAGARPDLVQTAGYVATGVGLTGLLVGTVAGVAAVVRFSDLNARCEANHCDVEDKPQLAQVQQFATIADVAFLTAAAGLGTGAVLFWVVPKVPSVAAGSGSGAVLTGRVAF